MIRHIAMFQFTDDSTPEAQAAMLDDLRALPDHLPAVRSFQVGTDVGLRPNAWDAVVVADFDDVEGWRSYAEDAEHLRIIAEELEPIVTQRASVQYEW